MPEENYWFRRHLVVYEWIAARVAGLDVIDMASGEGYGADVLAGAARSVVGVDANPEAHEHSRLRYVRSNLSFARDLVETYDGEADAISFLQTIEHVEAPGDVLEHFKALLRPGGSAYISTPNVLTLAPEGADGRATRGTCASTAPRSSPACWLRTSTAWSSTGSTTRASCAPTTGR